LGETIPSKLCGRPFDGANLETIHREIAVADPPLRAAIARRVCRALDWSDALGRPKLRIPLGWDGATWGVSCGLESVAVIRAADILVLDG
jgi:hypothetical protein